MLRARVLLRGASNQHKSDAAAVWCCQDASSAPSAQQGVGAQQLLQNRRFRHLTFESMLTWSCGLLSAFSWC